MQGSQRDLTQHIQVVNNAVNDIYAAYIEFTKKEQQLKNEFLNDIQKILNQTMEEEKQFAKECKSVSQEMEKTYYLTKYIQSKRQSFMEHVFSQESQQTGADQ